MNLDLKSLTKPELISLLQELEDAEPGKVSQYVEAWNTSPHYRAMKHRIRAALNPMLDRGSLSRKNVRAAVSKMRRLLKQIDNAYSKGQNEKAFWAGMAMFESWNHQICHTDDRSGLIIPLIDTSWAIVEASVDDEYDPEIRLAFATYLLKIIKEDNLRRWHWWINPILLLCSMDSGLEIDRELLVEVNKPQSVWDEKELANTRIVLTERVYGKQAAEELTSSLMHLDSIRLREIESALDQSNYQRAKDLCLEAADREHNKYGNGYFWMVRLLEVSEFEGDKKSQKIALTHLVLNGSQEVREHWTKLRPLLSEVEANQIIKTVTTPDTNKQWDISKETIIVLLGSEGHTERLLTFLKDYRSPRSLEAAETYLPNQRQTLAQLWKEEILDRLSYSYSSQNAGWVAEYLQNILRLVGTDEAQVIKQEILSAHPLKTSLKSQFDGIV